MKRAIHCLPVFLIGLLFLSQTIRAQITPSAGRLYVKENSTGTGESWANAANLTQALLHANANAGTVTEIWVAGGTYTPESYDGITGNSLGDRDKTFLVNKVALYGGFSGNDISETVATRKWTRVKGQKVFTYTTTLSGDIGTPDNAMDNCYHVVIATGELSSTEARIDGFVITGGNASGPEYVSVNGMEVVRNSGGGIYAFSNVTLANNTLSGNLAQTYGGGVYADYATLTGNTLSGNIALLGGGVNAYSNVIMTDNILSGNKADSHGGGIHAISNVTLTGNTLFGNESGWHGGGVYALSDVTLTNNTLSGNMAEVGGGGIYARRNGNLINNILWANTSNNLEIANTTTITASYNLIGDAALPAGISDSGDNKVGTTLNPLFKNPATGDFSIKGGSLAIDAGSNNAYSAVEGTDIDTDLDAAGNKRLQDAAIDMGAYEYQGLVPGANKILYVNVAVDQDAPGYTGEGNSWQQATSSLTEALFHANTNPGTVTEIWVAGGTYIPESYAGLTEGTNPLTNRDNTFLVKQVALYGGFSGDDASETVATRKWTIVNGQKVFTHTTTLSGDIGVSGDATDNCNHVVIAIGQDGTDTCLDGFDITGGNASGTNTVIIDGIYITPNDGGGVHASKNVTLANNTLSGNLARNYGGGVYAGNVILTGNTLLGNIADYGGGVYAYSKVTMTDNILSGNKADSYGGGIHATNDVTLTGNTLFGNECGTYGGGVFALDEVILTNNTLYGNMAEQDGGGIYARRGTNLINNILWANTNNNLFAGNATITVSYNLIGDAALPPNITDGGDNKVGTTFDPLFTDPVNGDFSLQKGSPAIDAGSNDGYSAVEGTDINTDLDIAGNKRLQGAAIDMGAIETLPPPPPVYHTITLEVAPGILLNDISPGKITVQDGDRFFLRFIPEDAAVKAADLLFLLDGVETAFTDPDGNRYFTYSINPVNEDHTILIALREYPVMLPAVKGITLNPAPGIHKVAYGSAFRFTLTLSEEVDEKSVRVYVNGSEWTSDGDSNGSVVRIGQTTSLQYTINKITGPAIVEIHAEYDPVGNVPINECNVLITVENEKLKIENYMGEAINVTVYNMQGQLVTSRRVADSISVSLDKGLYVVKVGALVQKVAVN